MTKIIHHNSNCGTSRTVLEVLEAAGTALIVVKYLNVGWTRHHLRTLFAVAGVTARQALRTSGTTAEDLGLTDRKVNDDTVIAIMIAQAILVNRPFVATPKGGGPVSAQRQGVDLEG